MTTFNEYACLDCPGNTRLTVPAGRAIEDKLATEEQLNEALDRLDEFYSVHEGHKIYHGAD